MFCSKSLQFEFKSGHCYVKSECAGRENESFNKTNGWNYNFVGNALKVNEMAER